MATEVPLCNSLVVVHQAKFAYLSYLNAVDAQCTSLAPDYP